MVPSPGPPASWSVSLVEYGRGATSNGGVSNVPKGGGKESGGGGGGGGGLGVVECGVPFYLEVQALDAFANK